MFFAATTPPRMVTLVLITAIPTLSLTMFLPSLSAMAVDFQTDYALVNLSVGGYLAITAALHLVIGPLSDRYGRRPVLLTGIALFAAASIGCAQADSVWVFLGFRALQAGIISGFALSKAVVGDMYPARQAASLLGYISMAMAIGPILGPMIGGTLDQLFGWRASFVAFALLGTGLLILCWIDLGETNRQKSATFKAQVQATPELLRSRRFWGYALCIAFSTGAFYAFLSGAPLVADEVLDLSPAKLGFYLGTITIGFFVGSFLSGRYAKRYSLTTMMIVGRIAACAGLSVGLILFLAGIVSEASLFGTTIFVGIGNGLTMPSANAGTISVRPKLAGSASGLAGSLNVAFGALVTTVTGAIVGGENAVYLMVGAMLACSALGLFAALAVLWIDRREGAIAARQKTV